MKKLVVIIAFVLLVSVSSCVRSVTCPTYTKADIEQNTLMPKEAL